MANMTMTNPEWISSAAFIALMTESRATWDCLQDQTISHKVYGQGTVVDAQPTELGWRLEVRFDEKVTTVNDNNQAVFYLPEALNKGYICQVAVSEELRKRLEEAARQPIPPPASKPVQQPEPARNGAEWTRVSPEPVGATAESRHLRELKRKYHIEAYAVRWPEGQLYKVLRALDEGRYDQVDEGLLIRDRLHPLLAVVYEKRGLRAKASSEWRKANKPQRALDVTRDCKECNQIAELTARGAALRQLDRLDEAEFCARKAISLTDATATNRWYPWNLLGAVMVQIGNFEEAEVCFRTADELGGDEKDRDSWIKSAVELIRDPNQQRHTALFYYGQDPGRHAWAKAYLVAENET